MTIIRIGLDTAKHVFQVHGVDEDEEPVLRKQLRRSEMERFFGKLAPTRIGLEACGASHHWARVLRALGHEVVLLPAQYIKPYVKRGKNDVIDAAAICEAMSRPGMRFVAIKSAEQQAGLMLLKARDLLVKQRTMLVNAIRGHAAEFGLVAAKGPVKVAELLQRAHTEESGVPALALEMLSLLSGQLDVLEVKLKAIETRLLALHKENPLSRCLATQPGIGPIGAISFALKVSDPKGFGSGRHFAAWLGLTPRENSTGGRHRPGRISRQGDEGLRKLLVLGATAVIRFVKGGKDLALVDEFAGTAAEKARRRSAGQQDGPDALGHDGERRVLSPAATGLSRSPSYHLALARNAARWRSVEPRVGTLRGIL